MKPRLRLPSILDPGNTRTPDNRFLEYVQAERQGVEMILGRRRWVDLGKEIARDSDRLISETIAEELRIEILRGARHGSFHSVHELASVLREEYDEFWESVKADDPDPEELLQIAAVALRGINDLCTKKTRISALNFKHRVESD